jgi:hypothetical protein
MRKRDAWEAFRGLAAQAERGGLKQLGAAAIPPFAAQYREVAADLARARTYGVDPRVIEYLERVVSAGHNALYGRHTTGRLDVARLLLREIPAAVVAGRAYVLAALIAFAVPAVTGFLLLRERPAVAEEVLPDEMIARASAGAERRAEGVGYAEAPSMYLPVVASRIITNNVQVAFFAFALGSTAGLGTLSILVMNGLFFGAVLGLFANTRWSAGCSSLSPTTAFLADGDFHRGGRISRSHDRPWRPDPAGRAGNRGADGGADGGRLGDPPGTRWHHRGTPLGKRCTRRLQVCGERRQRGLSIPLLEKRSDLPAGYRSRSSRIWRIRRASVSICLKLATVSGWPGRRTGAGSGSRRELRPGDSPCRAQLTDFFGIEPPAAGGGVTRGRAIQVRR